MIKQLALLCACALYAVFAAGCLLVSGERTSQDAEPQAGNRSATFVSAEGDELRSLEVGAPDATLQVIVILEAEQGELRLDVLDASNAVAFSVQSRPDEQVTRSGTVSIGAEGVLRYRITARGARNGGYQLLYQQQ